MEKWVRSPDYVRSQLSYTPTSMNPLISNGFVTIQFSFCGFRLGPFTGGCALPAELYPHIQFPQKFFKLPKSISSIFSFSRAYFRINHPICQLANFAEFWPDSKFPLGTFTGVLGLPAELYPRIFEPVASGGAVAI